MLLILEKRAASAAFFYEEKRVFLKINIANVCKLFKC
jgi:hypothetical protein